MSESRFFEPPSGMTIGEIVALTGAQARRRHRPVAPHHQYRAARPGRGRRPQLRRERQISRSPEVDASRRLPDGRAVRGRQRRTGLIVLRSREPHRDFTTVARKMYANALRPVSLFGITGVAPGAVVHPSAKIDKAATVDPGAVVGPNAEIGPGTVIGAGAVIGPAVRIGRDCSIGAGSTITHSIIGDRVIVHPGCRIGQDGFGFVPDGEGPRQNPSDRRRHHPGRRRDRRRHRHRPRRHARHA